jgi:SAM-dependent methyltransferase
MEQRDYYDDPERYDAEYGFLSADLEWYRSRVSESGGPALVLGCGTGRVLFHLARAGIRVDGIDNKPAMLDLARSRALTIGRDIGLFEADIRDFSLSRRYRAVVAPLNLLMHLHSDRELLECLECVKTHLLDRGILLFDISNPRDEILLEHGGPQGIPLRDVVVRGVKYLQREHHRYDPESKISEVTFTFEPGQPESRPFVTRLRLRMFSPGDIRRLLGLAGFKIHEYLGSFAGEQFDGSGLTQIIVAGVV